MHRRKDAHRLVVGIFTRDLLVHVEEVAVFLSHPIPAVPLDRVGEIEIDRQPRGAGPPALITRLFRSAGGDMLTWLRNRHRSFTDKEPYALFGLTPGCGIDAVQKAYYSILRESTRIASSSIDAPPFRSWPSSS